MAGSSSFLPANKLANRPRNPDSPRALASPLRSPETSRGVGGGTDRAGAAIGSGRALRWVAVVPSPFGASVILTLSAAAGGGGFVDLIGGFGWVSSLSGLACSASAVFRDMSANSTMATSKTMATIAQFILVETP